MTDRQSDGGGAVSLAVARDYTPQKRADVLELDMGDGIVLYDPGSKLLWLVLAAFGLPQEFGLDPRELREQFSGLIAELDALGVLHDTNDSPDVSESPERERDERHA